MTCIDCGRSTDLYLHQGRIYCVWCLPTYQLPPANEAMIVRERCRLTREQLRRTKPAETKTPSIRKVRR